MNEGCVFVCLNAAGRPAQRTTGRYHSSCGDLYDTGEEWQPVSFHLYCFLRV